MEHIIHAFADDLVFIAKSKTELCSIINKLNKKSPYLTLNNKKSGIMPMGCEDLRGLEEFMGIPVV